MSVVARAPSRAAARSAGLRAGWLLVAQLGMAACQVEPAPVERVRRGIVYGADDRREYYQMEAPEIRARIESSVVALIPKTALFREGSSEAITARSWRDAANLCEGEPFAEQPAAAFCSGVLVDWDLVLTAAHCTRTLATRAFAVVFGYYYQQAGKLTVAPEDVFDVARVVAERSSQPGTRPRTDHAWLRLERPVQPPRQPAPLRRATASRLSVGEPVLFVGASGGVPLKADQGGAITSLGGPWYDYFVASTDTARGASGGGAFDAEQALLGILERGSPDFRAGPMMCNETVREPEERSAEEFTFAARALEELCARSPAASSLCRPDCGDPCLALSPGDAALGCSVVSLPPDPPPGAVILALVYLAYLGSRRRCRGP
jgi:hypothetical protein